MRISAKAEYACLAMIELARPNPDGSPRRVRDVAEAHGIPARYLVQILLHLKSAGLVQSVRGAEGGYLISRPIEQITIADIITIVDGPHETLRKTDSSIARELCRVLEQARAAEHSILAATPLSRLLMVDQPHDWVL